MTAGFDLSGTTAMALRTTRSRVGLLGLACALLTACTASPDHATDPLAQAGGPNAGGVAGAAAQAGQAAIGGAGVAAVSGGTAGGAVARAGNFAPAAGAGGVMMNAAGVSGSTHAGTGSGTAGTAPAAGTAGPAPSTAGSSGIASTAGAGAGGSTVPTAGTGGAPAADSGGTGARQRVTVWIAGDSTVMTYTAADAPQEGWGQELGMFMQPEATLNNQALGGRSTRTFMYGNVTCENGAVRYTGGTPNVMGTRWERIVTNIKPGDFCLIQFGHNDGGTVCERHVDIPEFKRNLSAMASAIRERMATPLFITPMSQLSYANGMFKATLTDYSAAMKEQATADRVALIDLNTASVEFYRSAGYAKVMSEIFMPGESTHFQKQGAIELARLVSKGIAANGGDLARYVK